MRGSLLLIGEDVLKVARGESADEVDIPVEEIIGRQFLR
jgi:hypothetical protein